MNNLDETILMRLVQHGDRAALSEIIRRHRTEVLRYCEKRIAGMGEYLALEVFCLAARQPDTYTPGANVQAWLISIARNRARKQRVAS